MHQNNAIKKVFGIVTFDCERENKVAMLGQATQDAIDFNKFVQVGLPQLNMCTYNIHSYKELSLSLTITTTNFYPTM